MTCLSHRSPLSSKKKKGFNNNSSKATPRTGLAPHLFSHHTVTSRKQNPKELRTSPWYRNQRPSSPRYIPVVLKYTLLFPVFPRPSILANLKQMKKCNIFYTCHNFTWLWSSSLGLQPIKEKLMAPQTLRQILHGSQHVNLPDCISLLAPQPHCHSSAVSITLYFAH